MNPSATPSNSPYEQPSSSLNASAPLEESSPPSYSSLFPDYPDAGHTVGSVNPNQYGYPPYTPYPQQQYILSSDSTPLMVGPLPAMVHSKQFVDSRNITPITPTTTLIYGNNCPLCRVGVMEDDYPFGAICCAILFFPIGLLCCWCLRQERCNNCGYIIE